MSSTMETVFRITPTLQTYDWGRIGSQSKVAQLAAGADIPGFELDNSVPYAELWMGTHVKSPSGIVGSSKSLLDVLALNPHLIGDDVPNKFPASRRGNLPFLFKVLSINKALSIQTHPDKKTAEELHAKQPTVYTDDNHKPEMAIALTDFEGLCGFLPVPDIKIYLRNVPELCTLVSKQVADRFLSAEGPDEREHLLDLFSALMQANPDTVKIQLSQLTARYKAQKERNDVENLVLSLHKQYPGDVGVFCPFVLNYVKLVAGQAIFLGAGEPHAYISGDIMECMANSDNVIRAGLTPKPKDIPSLLAGLTYKAAPWSNHMVQPSTAARSATITYDPPVQDFTVLALNLAQRGSESQNAVNGPSIMITTEGAGFINWDKDKSLALKPGNVVFVGANVPVSFSALDSLTVFRAYVK